MALDLLIIDELHAGYGAVDVLHDVSITVGECEIVALIGPNGAGKSTILRAIFSQADKRSGTISFSGHDITKVKTSALLSLGISYIPQGRPVFSCLTVDDNLRLGGHLIKDKKYLFERLEKVYKQFPELSRKKNILARNLSGGQQQLCAIARGLVVEPKLLLLDEPSLGLAPNICKEMFAYLKDLTKQGISLLIVEQNVHLVFEICDRGYLLAAGQIAAEGSKETLKKSLDEVYLGKK